MPVLRKSGSLILTVIHGEGVLWFLLVFTEEETKAKRWWDRMKSKLARVQILSLHLWCNFPHLWTQPVLLLALVSHCHNKLFKKEHPYTKTWNSHLFPLICQSPVAVLLQNSLEVMSYSFTEEKLYCIPLISQALFWAPGKQQWTKWTTVLPHGAYSLVCV